MNGHRANIYGNININHQTRKKIHLHYIEIIAIIIDNMTSYPNIGTYHPSQGYHSKLAGGGAKKKKSRTTAGKKKGVSKKGRTKVAKKAKVAKKRTVKKCKVCKKAKCNGFFCFLN
jgi:hypothetical protein